MISIKSTYHIALNDIGLILQGSPEQPAYVMEQATILNNRYAQGDRSYDDFAKWWYWAQTDWSQGFRDDPSWVDDAKFYFSTNIDTWSEAGAIKLAKGLVLNNDFSENISCGSFESIAGLSYDYIGTVAGTGNKPKLYRYATGSWTDIISSYIPAGDGYISDSISHGSKLWVTVVGSSTTYVVFHCDADGANQVDHTADIVTAMGAGWTQIESSHCVHTDGSTIYIAVKSTADSKFGIVKSSDNGSTFTKVLSFDYSGTIKSLWIEGGYLYFIILTNSVDLELMRYDVANDVNISLQTFKNCYITTTDNASWSRKLIRSFKGSIIVTIPSKEIWKYSSGSLERILKKDDFKDSLSVILGESSFALDNTPNDGFFKGCIEHDFKLWWGNLMYDGDKFFNTIKDFSDTINTFAFPVYSNGSLIRWGRNSDKSLLYQDSGYKGTADKNYIVLGNFDKVSGINKIAYSVDIIFKKLASGQKIIIEYLTGELTDTATWTVLGSASYTTDGGTITDKTLYFPVNTTFKKIWIRIKLEGGGSDTPVLYDFIMAYLPRPYTDKRWRINVDCGDDIGMLNNNIENKRGRKIKGLLEKSWMTNQIVDFQDIDYASTLLKGALAYDATTIPADDTSEFPESGRIRIDNEVIYYTGKTPTSFTGCVRGQKGTKAVAHDDDSAINNGYKVIIEDFSSRVPIINRDKNIEYVVGLYLREII